VKITTILALAIGVSMVALAPAIANAQFVQPFYGYAPPPVPPPVYTPPPSYRPPGGMIVPMPPPPPMPRYQGPVGCAYSYYGC
jgi:hypothetical protein